MSGIRVLGAVAILLATAVACGTMSAGSQEGASDMEKRLTELQTRVETLERQLQALRAAAPAAPAAPSPADAALEQEAMTAFQNIDRLLNSGQAEQAKAELVPFMQKYGQTNVGRNASRLTQELAVVGKAAPTEWKIDKWFQGQDKISLPSDKATLVVFWETWCPHCRREVPKLQQVYDKWSPKGLQVVALTKITKSSTEQSVTDFIAESKMSYPTAKESGELSQYFNVSGIPAAAVVKGGKIVWRGHPIKLTDEMIQSWL